MTESRTAEAIHPADPADIKSSEAVIQQAGGVWFPDSAYKTAQAIRDFNGEDLPLMIFANWRGFSGGQRDMFDEVLKFGALIVDALVAFKQPVFVYIPPFAELRGGAWVVVDATINASVMEFYAAKGSARGGVLEPNGAAAIKFKYNDLIKTMHRLDTGLKELDGLLLERVGGELEEVVAKIKYRENLLLPVYDQLSVHFADLHDTPGRMKEKGVIREEIEWSQARKYFYWRLRRRLAEFDLRAKMGGGGVKESEVIREWFLETGGETEGWNNDKKVLEWLKTNKTGLENKLKQREGAKVTGEVMNGIEKLMAAGLTESEKAAFKVKVLAMMK